MQITDLCSTLHLEFIKIREEVLNLGHKWESPDCGREGVLRLRFCFFFGRMFGIFKNSFSLFFSLYATEMSGDKCEEVKSRCNSND